jgi:hypothetical protein
LLVSTGQTRRTRHGQELVEMRGIFRDTMDLPTSVFPATMEGIQMDPDTDENLGPSQYIPFDGNESFRIMTLQPGEANDPLAAGLYTYYFESTTFRRGERYSKNGEASTSSKVGRCASAVIRPTLYQSRRFAAAIAASVDHELDLFESSEDARNTFQSKNSTQ